MIDYEGNFKRNNESVTIPCSKVSEHPMHTEPQPTLVAPMHRCLRETM